jgi:hypothetical protein
VIPKVWVKLLLCLSWQLSGEHIMQFTESPIYSVKQYSQKNADARENYQSCGQVVELITQPLHSSKIMANKQVDNVCLTMRTEPLLSGTGIGIFGLFAKNSAR